MSVMRGADLKLLRCVELPELDEQEVMSVLLPTFAYVEDQLTAAQNLSLCGFGDMTADVSAHCERELGVKVEPLASRIGEPGEANAGLLGYLESSGE